MHKHFQTYLNLRFNIMARFNIDRDSAIKIYKNKDEENEDNSDVEKESEDLNN